MGRKNNSFSHNGKYFPIQMSIQQLQNPWMLDGILFYGLREKIYNAGVLTQKDYPAKVCDSHLGNI